MTEWNLGRNDFTGTMPSELGRMGKVETGGAHGFVMSNQLTRTVPSELGMCLQMTSDMNGGSNKFTGPLPTGERLGDAMAKPCSASMSLPHMCTLIQLHIFSSPADRCRLQSLECLSG